MNNSKTFKELAVTTKISAKANENLTKYQFKFQNEKGIKITKMEALNNLLENLKL